MGMFDWIRFETDCPNCGEHLEHFQSKDKCGELGLVKPHKVRNFYTSCHKCKAWINYYKAEDNKKWTRTVLIDFGGTLLHEHTEEFSKKYLKAHTTEK